MAKKKKKTVRINPKRRTEIDDDLFEEIKKVNSLPNRIEFILIQILRELKKLNSTP